MPKPRVSSTPSPNRIEIVPRPSRLIAGYLLIIHLIAAAATAALPPILIVHIVLFLLIAASLMFTLRRYALLQDSHSLGKLIWSEDDGWQFEERSGETCAATLLPRRYVVPWLIVLNFRLVDDGRRTVVLALDSVAADAQRRLRVRLQHES
jgi:hypothetical protein